MQRRQMVGRRKSDETKKDSSALRRCLEALIIDARLYLIWAVAATRILSPSATDRVGRPLIRRRLIAPARPTYRILSSRMGPSLCLLLTSTSTSVRRSSRVERLGYRPC